MWVDNTAEFGLLINSEHFDITKVHPDFYEIYNNQFAWGLRYIHKEYKDIFENRTGVLREVSPCFSPLKSIPLDFLHEGFTNFRDPERIVPRKF